MRSARRRNKAGTVRCVAGIENSGNSEVEMEWACMINLSPGQRAIKAVSRCAWVKLLISCKQYTAIYYFEIPVIHRKNPK